MVRSFPDPAIGLQISPDTVLDNRSFWSADGQSVASQYETGSIVETRLRLAGGPAVLSRAVIPVSMPATKLEGAHTAFAVTAFAPNGGLLGILLEALTGGDVVVPNWVTEMRERIATTNAK